MTIQERNCGCKSGLVAALTTLVGYVGYLVVGLDGHLTLPPSRSHVLTALALTLGAAVVGKLGGILYYAWRSGYAMRSSQGRIPIRLGTPN
jgi:hypothetical protein